MIDPTNKLRRLREDVAENGPLDSDGFTEYAMEMRALRPRDALDHALIEAWFSRSPAFDMGDCVDVTKESSWHFASRAWCAFRKLVEAQGYEIVRKAK